MQRYCTELTERLLKSLDKEYNVVDMAAVVDVITALEKTTITKEVLEITRLGKYINELRRKTSNDALAKRAKVLLRRWRNMVLPQATTTPQPTPADTAPPALNGAKPQSPALRGFKPQSPALRGLKPQSPISRDISTPLRVLSPALSVHSENSHSPITTPNKQHQLPPPPPPLQQQQQQQQQQQPPPSITVPSLHRILHPEGSPKLRVSSQNHLTEAVPRTHSSNKRLRKDENQQQQQYDITSPINETESLAKRQRLNGENSNSGISCNLTNAQVPIVTLSERISEQFVEVSAISKSTTITTAVTTTTTSTAAAAAAATSTTSTTEETEATVGSELDNNAAAGPKKRGRKKGSKSVKKAPPQEDSIKEKLASVSRNPKIKTTQELLADIRARGSSNNANFGGPTSQCTEPPRMEDVLRDSDEQVSKYLRSSSAATQNNSIYKTSNFGNIQNRSKNSSSRKRDLATPSPDSDALDGGRTTDNVLGKKKAFTSQDLTVDEILAQLPPLDPSTIEWSDHDEDEKQETDDLPQEPREISTEDLDRLHSQCIEGLNGNWQPKLSSLTAPLSGSGDDGVAQSESPDHPKHEFRDHALGGKKSSEQGDRIFREWHEMLARPSYDGQILHILPYVIID